MSPALNEVMSRAGVYRLLARLWIREVDLPLLEQLHELNQRSDLAPTAIQLPDLDAEAIETLSVDYCQLFVGPSGHFPPCQSVWQTGQFLADTTVSMRRYVEVIGYLLDESISDSYLDHLGIQFDVMAHILTLLAQSDEQTEQHVALREIEASYLEAHLHWPTALLEAAEAKATTRFYQSLIALTQQFLRTEANA